MNVVQNVMNGQYYEIRWRLYSERLASEAIPVNGALKTIQNPNRMDFVTLSPDAVKAIKEVQSTRMDP